MRERERGRERAGRGVRLVGIVRIQLRGCTRTRGGLGRRAVRGVARCAPFSGVILTRPSTLPLVRLRRSDVSDSGSVEISPATRSNDDSKQFNMSTMHEGGTRSWREGASSSRRPIGRWPSLRSWCTSCLGGPHFFASASRDFSSRGFRPISSSVRKSIFFFCCPTLSCDETTFGIDAVLASAAAGFAEAVAVAPFSSILATFFSSFFGEEAAALASVPALAAADLPPRFETCPDFLPPRLDSRAESGTSLPIRAVGFLIFSASPTRSGSGALSPPSLGFAPALGAMAGDCCGASHALVLSEGCC